VYLLPHVRHPGLVGGSVVFVDVYWYAGGVTMVLYGVAVAVVRWYCGCLLVAG
jgi:type IV secretory pathway TrbD component